MKRIREAGPAPGEPLCTGTRTCSARRTLYTSGLSLDWRSNPVKSIVLSLMAGGIVCGGPGAAAAPELPMESMFSEGGVTGSPPRTIRWSPDGSRVAYLLEDDQGHNNLYSADVKTRKPVVLVSADKLAKLAPPTASIGNEREIERRTRYSVAAYHWAPDSRHILFDANGQLWFYSLDTGTAVSLSLSPEAVDDPTFSPDGKHLAYIRKH